jgi:hypothetical protein
MILTASDVSSLSTMLDRWEWVEYVAEGFVVLGCVGELVADAGEKCLGERRSKHLERWSTVVLIVALLVSLTALWRTNELTGYVIGSLGDKAGEADAKAQTALKDSANASAEAAWAKSTAETASTTADKAGRSANGALTIAGEAKADVATVQSNIAKVDEKYAPRTLSKIKRDILIELLRKTPAKPKEQIDVEVSADASDGPAFANEIVDAINDQSTGWKDRAHGELTGDGRSKGVWLLLHDADSEPLWAGDLQRALQAAGLGGEGQFNPAVVPTGTAVIVVNPKN